MPAAIEGGGCEWNRSRANGPRGWVVNDRDGGGADLGGRAPDVNRGPLGAPAGAAIARILPRPPARAGQLAETLRAICRGSASALPSSVAVAR